MFSKLYDEVDAVWGLFVPDTIFTVGIGKFKLVKLEFKFSWVKPPEYEMIAIHWLSPLAVGKL
jgi:hypothetical protein